MADVLESLVVKLALDGSDYDSGIKNAQGSLDSFAGGAARVGTVMSAAVTAPIVAIGAASLSMASDLNETVSKVETLFGDNAASIQAWADTSAQSFGLSSQAALDAVGGLGNMFMQLGAGGAEAATLSQSMVGLSADLASFHNVAGGSEEVLGAMTSAFRGEYDALQRYIPTINAAAVEQAALAATGKESAKELTALEKATAVQALIMEGAGAAVGDFARTSDGLANSTRIMQAELANVGAELGQQLLPIALEVAKALGGLLKWFSDLSPETKKWILIIGGAAAAIGPVLVTLAGVASAVSTIITVVTAAGPVIAGLGAALTLLTGPIGLVVAAVALLAAGWATDFLGMRTKTQQFWNWISTETPRQLNSLQSSWNTFTTFLTSDNETKLATVRRGWEIWYGWLDERTGGTLSTVQGYYESGMTNVATVVGGGLQILQGDWEGGLETIRGVAENVWAGIYDIFGTQIDAIQRVITDVDWGGVGSAIVQGIADGITNAWGWLEDAAQGAAQRALDSAKSWLGIGSPSKVAAEEIGVPFAQGVAEGAGRAMADIAGRIDAGLAGLFDNLAGAPASSTPAMGGGMTLNIYLNGSATEEDGRRVALGIDDELRSRGLR